MVYLSYTCVRKLTSHSKWVICGDQSHRSIELEWLPTSACVIEYLRRGCVLQASRDLFNVWKLYKIRDVVTVEDIILCGYRIAPITMTLSDLEWRRRSLLLLETFLDTASINYMWCTGVNAEAQEACNFNCCMETEGFLKVTGSHVQWKVKTCNISRKRYVQYRDAVTKE